ncbi:MAG: hypothetical protein PT934_06085 [Peptoniphilaceae bacterium]|nr:hypothetical protein [Parvimonas sp.]MDD7765320.1 hypothetical protein [Peptoniphilaceae bacterium]MDY3050932.1 hypothetical protein [Parvimonas sp.]
MSILLGICIIIICIVATIIKIYIPILRTIILVFIIAMGIGEGFKNNG